jgi:hypothetical protein
VHDAGPLVELLDVRNEAVQTVLVTTVPKEGTGMTLVKTATPQKVRRFLSTPLYFNVQRRRLQHEQTSFLRQGYLISEKQKAGPKRVPLF